MNVSSWYADVDFATSSQLADEVEFDVLEALAGNAAVMSIAPDRMSGSVSMTVEADSAETAAANVHKAISIARRLIGPAEITRLDLMTEQVRTSLNDSPSIPDLVGFAEIAELAGVSRQRAREISHLSGFPTAVVETASGPLRVKEAVESWLSRWERKPGRPSRSVLA